MLVRDGDAVEVAYGAASTVQRLEGAPKCGCVLRFHAEIVSFSLFF